MPLVIPPLPKPQTLKTPTGTPASSTPLPPSNLNQGIVSNVALAFIGKIGVAGFMFSVKQELSTHAKATVTENWVQAGFNINDNVVLPPATITLRGIVSETEIRKSIISNTATTIAKVVGIVTSFLPTLTNISKSLFQKTTAQQQTINTSNLLSNFATNTFDIYSAVQNLIVNLSNQGQVHSFFNAIMESKTIISILTPWRFYESVLITDVIAISPQSSNSWCNMEIKFQQWRSYQLTASTILYQPQNTATGIKTQMAQIVNNGTAKGIINSSGPNISNFALRAKLS